MQTQGVDRMMKRVCLLLAVFMLFSISGCDTSSEKEISYSQEDILVDRAADLAEQILQSAKPAAMQVLGATEDMISSAGLFAQADASAPKKARILYTDDTDFAQTLTSLNANHTGIIQLACSGLLSCHTQFMLPINLKSNAVVLLEYDGDCRIAVVITPHKSGIITVYGYPLFPDAAEALLNRYFDDAAVLNAEQIAAARLRGQDIRYEASFSKSSVDSDHYIDLALSAFENAEAADSQSISAYTQDESVTEMALAFSQALSQRTSATAVCQFSAAYEAELDAQLSPLLSNRRLQEAFRRRLYLSVPRQFSARYGTDVLAASVIVQNLLETELPGPAAHEGEAPVLVFLEFSNGITAIVSICSGENNLYSFAYSFVPVGWEELRSAMVEEDFLPVA